MHVWMKEALCPKAWNPASPATSLQFQDWLFLCDVSFRRENQPHLSGRTHWSEQWALGDGQEGAHRSRVAGQAGCCWCSRLGGLWEGVRSCRRDWGEFVA